MCKSLNQLAITRLYTDLFNLIWTHIWSHWSALNPVCVYASSRYPKPWLPACKKKWGFVSSLTLVLGVGFSSDSSAWWQVAARAALHSHRKPQRPKWHLREHCCCSSWHDWVCSVKQDKAAMCIRDEIVITCFQYFLASHVNVNALPLGLVMCW